MGIQTERMAALKAQMNELKKQYRDASKEAFYDAAKELFEENPAMESFSWHQYTPYFNDGDSCEFGVYADDEGIQINGVGYYDTYDLVEDGFEMVTYGQGTRWEHTDKRINYKRVEVEEHAAIAPLFEAVAKFVNTIDEDVLKDMFGDHVEVTVKRDGTVDVEHYEHD